VGVTPVTYGDGLRDRLRALAPDAFIDTYGDGYVDLAVDLGVPGDRIDTIIDYPAAQKHGAKAEGSSTASSADVLAYMASLVAWGTIVLPISAVYPLGLVKDAYRELAERHTRGKIVLATELADEAGRQGPAVVTPS